MMPEAGISDEQLIKGRFQRSKTQGLCMVCMLLLVNFLCLPTYDQQSPGGKSFEKLSRYQVRQAKIS